MEEALKALAGEHVDWRFKGMPPQAQGLTIGELAAERRPLFTGGFITPVLTLSAAALEHNLDLLERFTAEHGLSFAPHGKTSMAPQLFARQLARGAWGITAAVPHQVRVYRAFGVPRIFLANEVVDASALAWIASELDADPDFGLVAYVDSPRGVALMDEGLRGAGRRLDVVVELGCDGGRTGVRDEAAADAVADAVARSGTLRLVGVAGYEGELREKTPETVRAWVRRLVALARRFDAAGRFADAEQIIVSAGGSAWFDAVADVLGPVGDMSRPVLRLLRSGAYVTHDDGHYRQVTPYNRLPGDDALSAAFRLWAQVVSRPEPGLALLNAGKRDAAYDLHLPMALEVRGADGKVRPVEGLSVTGLADQHTFVEVAAGTELEVGDWVGLGLSHPCTSFDKWQLIPQVAEDGTVTDLIRTFF
jgi:D-serine deaminase-like pyridoxal phosphate-dependent protein